MPCKIGLAVNETLGAVQGLTGGALSFDEIERCLDGREDVLDLIERRPFATHILEYDAENVLTTEDQQISVRMSLGYMPMARPCVTVSSSVQSAS